MSLGFISDIHLDSNSPKKTQMFFDFLDQAKNKYSKLFILGDLFEYWIGDDDQSQDSLEVIKQLKILRFNRSFLYCWKQRFFNC